MDSNHDDRLEQNAVFRATIDFIDKRITTSESRNKDEHDAIVKKIELHNGFATKLAATEKYCGEMQEAKLRDRVKALEVSIKVGIFLVISSFGLLTWMIQHAITLLIKKITGI